MNPTDLSVSELARITGLAIDPTWNCATATESNASIAVWCAPERRAEDLLGAALSSCPAAGSVRVEWRTGDAFWDAEWPMSFDLHWLREITPGFPLGVRPVRVRTERPVQSAIRIQGDFASVFWRDESGRSRVEVRRCPQGNWAVEVESGAELSRARASRHGRSDARLDRLDLCRMAARFVLGLLQCALEGTRRTDRRPPRSA